MLRPASRRRRRQLHPLRPPRPPESSLTERRATRPAGAGAVADPVPRRPEPAALVRRQAPGSGPRQQPGRGKWPFDLGNFTDGPIRNGWRPLRARSLRAVREPASGSRAPLARHGGFSGSRGGGGGPLSAHTPHRGTGPRPGSAQPSQGGRPEQPRPESARVFVVNHRGCAGGFPALEAGRLHVVGGHSNDDAAGEPCAAFLGGVTAALGARAEARAAGATQVAEHARDHHFRRWPRPSAPRPASSSRPAAPGPAVKTQRPDKSMTREELLAMMRSGQLSNLQSPGWR